MRVLVPVLGSLVLAAPALAQPRPILTQPPLSPAWQAQDFEIRQQQEQMRQQLIQQQNQMTALETQLRAQQGVADIQAQKQFGQPPPPDLFAQPLPNVDTSAMASIPDQVLADSNKRILDAAQNHR